GGTELKIVGVIRPKKGATATYVSTAICYTPELAEFVVNKAYNSDIAKAQRNLIKNPQNDRNTVIFNQKFIFDDDLKSNMSITALLTKKLAYTSFIKAIGATKAPTYINMYPATYEQKINIGNYIKSWNTWHGGNIGYFDVSEMFIYNLTMVIDLVSIMLIAVASISLVVSTVMIGVITSNSVIERTREIGILRALGARKRDVRNVFIAETSLIGLSGGLLGIIVTYILCPIISLIIGAVSGVDNLLHFHPLHAFILVVLSLVLTVISGILPAIGASRKNVVDALRVD
ncbi:MAG: FtsX-like permease family protein, partial [Clostridia bacterium]|nr:FtsX-like permease family protein [Clostridia bacterium]